MLCVVVPLKIGVANVLATIHGINTSLIPKVGLGQSMKYGIYLIHGFLPM